jgi:two-component system response regulator YesN
MLLFSPDPEYDWDNAAHDLALRVRSAIQTYTPFSVSVAYGDAIEDLYLLPEAKRQAIALMNYRFLNGGNQVFRSQGVNEEGKPAGTGEKDLSPIAQKLKRSVEQGNSAEAAELAKQFFDYLDRLESPAQLQNAVQNAIILIHSAGLESHRGIANSMSIEEELHKAERATNLQELKACLKQLTDRVIGDIREARESSNLKPVEQAKGWINEHLDQEITIKKIADQVYMNPTYFSEVFKMQTGDTVLDYLTRQRIERAKELLGDHKLKLQDICGRIGYQDVKYFSRLFKHWTGQTPSKFREQQLAQGGDETNEYE